ncbi:MAG TPA: type 2 isopentenyl-diphosphate Delta-isomerase, partial [Kiritimatiellae bacterium]|nr:type 2 isopentenyl-diphosphate Delta-isomerase [Kiritimatiellia bacterium]
HRTARDSFRLREVAPDTLLLANLGAVQLNCGFGAEECRDAVEVLGADGLYLHLNPLQEAVQPEGEARFAGLAEKIGDIAARLPVPVIVKEVGCGLDVGDVESLLERGVRHFEVAGSGGTSWSRIEHMRQPKADGHDLGLVFQDWGIPTPLALERLRPLQGRIVLIASGGIRTGIDMVKAMVLGASACAIALPFLHAAWRSQAHVEKLIDVLRREFRLAMFLLGVRRIGELIGNDELLLVDPFRST